MTHWRRAVHRPQQLLLRKAFFQIHLWTGIAVMLYVAVISVSGSAIVYRREVATDRLHRRLISAGFGRTRMSIEVLKQRVRRSYPSYDILDIFEPDEPDQPDPVVLQHLRTRLTRLFDPYTGADLGDRWSAMDRALGWLTDLHDNLLSGLTGRIVNGVGAFLVTLLAFTGGVVWWPGIKNWRRSLTIHPRARFARFNWGLHSAVGFWCVLFVLIWGISGIALCFPGMLNPVLSAELRYWIVRLHFGRFNAATEALWTILGLAPALLAATGALMWWNRVLSKRIGRWVRRSRRQMEDRSQKPEDRMAAERF
jgi:uncharacterized iron-regulated membrane protein